MHAYLFSENFKLGLDFIFKHHLAENNAFWEYRYIDTPEKLKGATEFFFIEGPHYWKNPAYQQMELWCPQASTKEQEVYYFALHNRILKSGGFLNTVLVGG